jgi:AraC-like DNA-binding protein
LAETAVGSCLSRYPAFRAETPDELAAEVERALGATVLDLGPPPDDFLALANCVPLQRGALWFHCLGVPLTLTRPESESLIVHVAVTGSYVATVGDREVIIVPGHACISSGARRLALGAGSAQLVWRAPRATVLEKWAALTGRPVPDRLVPFLDLDAREAAGFAELVRSLSLAADAFPPPAAGLVLGEIEEALILAFLGAVERQIGAPLPHEAPAAAPWQVRRAEAYIEAHWNEPLTVEILAGIAGTSARSLFRTFKQNRGCSPHEFIRRIRLERARDMLLDDGNETITEIALACGFGNPGRFSKEFADAFGERPSVVRTRAKTGRGPA